MIKGNPAFIKNMKVKGMRVWACYMVTYRYLLNGKVITEQLKVVGPVDYVQIPVKFAPNPVTNRITKARLHKVVSVERLAS